MDSEHPTQAAEQLQPTEDDIAFFDYLFRFNKRGRPVVEAMYSVASEWLMQEGYDRPLIWNAEWTPSVAKLDPLDVLQLEVRLPPLPAVMVELQEVLQSDNVSAGDVSKVIAQDPGLTAWLLKLVNSPYYGFNSKVSTISRAVALAGTRQIQALAIGGTLSSLAVLLPKGLVDMDRFWRHSLAAGIAAQELWRISGKSDGEQLFVSGILHDCGYLALAYAAPNAFSVINKSQAANPQPDYLAEQELLEFDHARLGGMLLHRWNMPLPLISSVLRHHKVEDPARYPEAAIVHVADALVTALGISTRAYSPVPPLSMEAWNVLKLSPEALQETAHVLRTKLDAICMALEP
jgi:Predicted signal transduction protein